MTLTVLPIGLIVSVDPRQLSNTTQMNVWIHTVVGNGRPGQWDEAPDGGVWNYDLNADGPDIRGVVTTITPGSGPKAGNPHRGRHRREAPAGRRADADDPAAGQVPLHREARRPAAEGPRHRLHVHGAEERARQAPFVAVTAHYEGATKTVQLQYRAGGIR